MIVGVVEADSFLGRDLEMFPKRERHTADIATGALKSVIHERGNERRVPAAEELIDVHVEARFRLAVEVELDVPGADRAPSIDPAGEPEVVQRARTLDVQDDVLVVLVGVDLGVGSVEAVVVSAGAVGAREIMRLDVGLQDGVA